MAMIFFKKSIAKYYKVCYIIFIARKQAHEREVFKMTISEQNIVKRWNLMASKDLGTDFNILAIQFSELFTMIFENDFTQIDAHNLKYILPLVRGFSTNNEGAFERCSVVECLDLCHIDLDKESAKELDWWLMNKMEWFSRYQFSLSI